MSRLSYRFKKWKRKVFRNIASADFPLFRFCYKIFHSEKSGSLSASLENYFRDKPCKVLQIGANDGLVNDPLFSLLYKYRWEAILLEPQSKVFTEELIPLYKNRPEVTCIQAAVSDAEGEEELFYIAFSNDRWATGLSSFKKLELQKQFDNGYVQSCLQKFGIPQPKPGSELIQSCLVPTLTFEKIFSTKNGFYPDLIIMDTEGFDSTLIRMYPFSLHTPKVLVYETPIDPQEKKASEERLLSIGYTLKIIQRDTLAILN